MTLYMVNTLCVIKFQGFLYSIDISQMIEMLFCVGEPSEIEKYHWLNISIKLRNVKLMRS